jgi:hypothetical protein
MGWNSWDSYGLTVKEAEFKANAEWMAQHLRRYGWQYAVVDEGWYLEKPEAKAGSFRFVMDQNGRYTPASNRFPSAANEAGFRQLAISMHSLGLKFGIHIIRGIPRQAVAKNLPIADSGFHATEAADRSDTCPWNKDNFGVKATPAGQAYYDSIAKLYASWGVDFVKVDCIASHPYKSDEIRMISDALKKTGRAIVLSLSPGPAPLDKADELRRYAQMWRISDDMWDYWKSPSGKAFPQSLSGQFAVTAKWAPHVVAGHWPDADMLPIGYLGPRPGEGKARKTRFTHDEQRTLMTLWSIFRSPLMMGGNLTSADEWTTSLLTNEDVIVVDQHSTESHPALMEGGKVVWVAKAEMGRVFYVALFNLADTAQIIESPLQPLGLTGASYTIRDLWERKSLGTADRLKARLEPHASVLYAVAQIE